MWRNLITAAAALWILTVSAQTMHIWRCGNAYTNSAREAEAKHCKLLESGNPVVGSSRPTGEVALPRAPDGHFYVDGSVNGSPVRFLVDTGASTVAISDRTAAAAGFIGAKAVVMNTAGGERVAHSGSGFVMAGSLFLANVEITTGLTEQGGLALLGQSFLRAFDIQVSGNTMVIKRH